MYFECNQRRSNRKELDDLEELCDLAVRALDEIIDYPKYRKCLEISQKLEEV